MSVHLHDLPLAITLIWLCTLCFTVCLGSAMKYFTRPINREYTTFGSHPFHYFNPHCLGEIVCLVQDMLPSLAVDFTH